MMQGPMNVSFFVFHLHWICCTSEQLCLCNSSQTDTCSY